MYIDSVQSMEEQTRHGKVLITGATDGIGFAAAQGMASQGYSVILHGRNEEKVSNAIHKLASRDASYSLYGVHADLSRPEEVEAMAEEILRNHPDLSILINNAGVFMNAYQEDGRGLEMTFSVNHLAYFHLTLWLLPLLRKNAPARIINVSSMAHGNTIHFDDLNLKKRFSGYEAYSQSKLANILFTYSLAEKLMEEKIAVNCLHPGVINTKLLRAGWGGMGSSLEKGAATILYLAMYDEGIHQTGKYYSNKKATQTSGESYNKATAQKLWEISENLTGIKFPG